MSIRVLVVDDHPFYREGVIASLSAFDSEIEMIGEAADGEKAVELCQQLRPDVVLMDLGMPGMGGLEAIRRIRERVPETSILALTMFDDDTVFAALRAGARGYILKKSGVDELSRAIRAVHRGEGIFSPSVTTRLQEFFVASDGVDATLLPALTPREREILVGLVRGQSVDTIARRLGVASKTVRNYLANVYAKLQVDDRAGAVAAARAAGLG